jgi:hypothetical protein
MEMNHTTKVITITEHSVRVTKRDLLFWLRRKEGATLEASAIIQVPGGGDWSNTSLDIDEIGGILVTWTDKTEE